MTIDQMNRIKDDRGYSFTQLSEYSGVPAVTLQRILTGKTANPRKATLDAIEKVLKGEESIYRGKAYEYGTSFGLNENTVVYGAESNAKNPGDYTLEDYYALPQDKRVELIDGVFYDMTAPKVIHQDIVGSVFFTFSEFLKKNKGKCKVMVSPVDVQLDCNDKTMVEPDVLVICDRSKIRDFGVMGAPDFVLEVLSESTRKKDLSIKVSKYLEAGVREYWIIDPYKKMMMVYNFEEEDFLPKISSLQGEMPVAIFGDKLKISLDELRDLIEEYEK
ncbi:MAG: Uma2 family endonuclease [Butyrivibrio sp.]|nr:Uma2 family endonuclease [Butyrivibrio sp.]